MVSGNALEIERVDSGIFSISSGYLPAEWNAKPYQLDAIFDQIQQTTNQTKQK